MKYCPKCRNFYDDAGLAFCLTDGIPLIEIDKANALWTEGAKAVETSQKIVSKQVRRQKFSKIAKILVTMMLIAISIYVVAMNIYVNIPTKGDEIAEKSTPSPTATPKQVEILIFEDTPTPTQSPTATRLPSPTPTKTLTPTPTKTPLPSPSATIIEIVCPKAEITAFILNNNFERWHEKINAAIPRFKQDYAENNQISVKYTRENFIFDKSYITVTPTKDCQKASVNIRYSIVISPINSEVRAKLYPGNETLVCTKKGNKWICP